MLFRANGHDVSVVEVEIMLEYLVAWSRWGYFGNGSSFLSTYPTTFPPRVSLPLSWASLSQQHVHHASMYKRKIDCDPREKSSAPRYADIMPLIQGRQVEVTRPSVLGYPDLRRTQAKKVVSRGRKTLDMRNETKWIAEMLRLTCTPHREIGLTPRCFDLD